MKLKEKLDRIFSTFIRLRDADNNGVIKCISCGTHHFWSRIHNGHYVNRSFMSTRFNEKNCNAQCVHCNTFKEGNPAGYTLGLLAKYGPNIIEHLHLLQNQTSKYSDFDYKVMIQDYSKKVKELKKEKGL